jgi:flagellar biosynthesis anti-sigma factor FlgM
MIDGISGGGGPIRGPMGQRQTPVESTATEPGRSLRRAAPISEPAALRAGRSALVADLAKSPPVNSARVAELKAQMQAGRYTVDPLRIADAMLKLDRSRP